MLFPTASPVVVEPKLTRKQRRELDRTTVKIGDRVQKFDGARWITFYRILPGTVIEPAVKLATNTPNRYRIVRPKGEIALVVVGKDSGRNVLI